MDDVNEVEFLQSLRLFELATLALRPEDNLIPYCCFGPIDAKAFDPRHLRLNLLLGVGGLKVEWTEYLHEHLTPNTSTLTVYISGLRHTSAKTPYSIKLLLHHEGRLLTSSVCTVISSTVNLIMQRSASLTCHDYQCHIESKLSGRIHGSFVGWHLARHVERHTTSFRCPGGLLLCNAPSSSKYQQRRQ